MSALSITWFGHATFVVTSPGGKRIVFDPWLTGNPKAPANAKIEKADVICVSHGHSDHTADVVPIHYGTFPLLTGTPDQLKKLVEPMGIDVLVLNPGETAQ